MATKERAGGRATKKPPAKTGAPEKGGAAGAVVHKWDFGPVPPRILEPKVQKHFTVRVPPEMQIKLKRIGYGREMSLNDVILTALTAFLDAEPKAATERAWNPFLECHSEEISYLKSALGLLRSPQHKQARAILQMLLKQWPNVPE